MLKPNTLCLVKANTDHPAIIISIIISISISIRIRIINISISLILVLVLVFVLVLVLVLVLVYKYDLINLFRTFYGFSTLLIFYKSVHSVNAIEEQVICALPLWGPEYL